MRFVPFLIAVCLLAAPIGAAPLAQSEPGSEQPPGPGYEFGRSRVVPVERTDRGFWQGAWFYSNRDMRMVLWLRDEEGTISARLQLVTNTIPPESFETDWDGAGSYNLQRGKGTFRLELASADENTITGTWKWDLDLIDSARLENGHFTMYRGGDGRMLVMNFDEFERVYRRGSKYEHYPSKHTMTFRKISNRLVQWDEIPF